MRQNRPARWPARHRHFPSNCTSVPLSSRTAIDISNLLNVLKRNPDLTIGFDSSPTSDRLNELLRVRENDVWWQYFNTAVDKMYIYTDSVVYNLFLVVEQYIVALISVVPVDKNKSGVSWPVIYLEAGRMVPRSFYKWGRSPGEQAELDVWLVHVSRHCMET
jgi:hypothetical protein